jgi:dCMP deaminase
MFDVKWTARFLEVAELIATWSKDPSTKVGAVLVNSEREIISTGYNGFPRRMDENSFAVNEQKNLFTIHAEINAIYNAARLGRGAMGCALFSTQFPCHECAKAISQAGIVTLYVPSLSYTWSDPDGLSGRASSFTIQSANIRIIECGRYK